MRCLGQGLAKSNLHRARWVRRHQHAGKACAHRLTCPDMDRLARQGLAAVQQLHGVAVEEARGPRVRRLHWGDE